jgi:hypothetical protein
MMIGRNDMKVNIAKALKLKNRLAGRLNKVEHEMRSCNLTTAWESEAKNPKWKGSMHDLNALRSVIKQHLVGTKAAIQRANIPLLESLIGLQEAKANLSFLTTISTPEGEAGGYPRSRKIKVIDTLNPTVPIEREEPLVAVCQWDGEKMKGAIANAQQDVEHLQDKIDEYNAITFIELPDSLQSLLG